MGYYDFNLDDRTRQAYQDSLRWFPEKADSIIHHALGLCGEAGEAANEVKKWDRGDKTSQELKEALTGELADVLVYIFSMAAIMGIDLEAAYDAKRRFNEERFGKKVSE